MKKETKVYTVLTHEEALRKKEFIKASYYDEGNNIVDGLVMTKSIYDKRKGMKKDLIRNCKNIDSATKKILLTDFEKIDDGDFD